LKQYKQEFEIVKMPSKKISLVSFLDGLQKVLLFVENINNLSEEVKIFFLFLTNNIIKIIAHLIGSRIQRNKRR